MSPAIQELLEALSRHGYIADPAIATAAFLARELQKPLLIEGEAGVGKTELAKALSRIFDTELIRLQCYEGLDVATALYEWDYPRQLLRLRMAESRGEDSSTQEAMIFSRDYLLERPLLRAISRQAAPAVLLIDEIDRADDAFEAFLLELLSDFQVTIPELGTIKAVHKPYVVLTSNHTRELGDALRRRCLYLYIEHPSFEKELDIIRLHCHEVAPVLAREVGRFVELLRDVDLIKPPGIAETLDFTRALATLEQPSLSAQVTAQALGCLLKDRRDFARVSGAELARLIERARELAP
jgi:MoxR-like ATPase